MHVTAIDIGTCVCVCVVARHLPCAIVYQIEVQQSVDEQLDCSA